MIRQEKQKRGTCRSKNTDAVEDGDDVLGCLEWEQRRCGWLARLGKTTSPSSSYSSWIHAGCGRRDPRPHHLHGRRGKQHRADRRSRRLPSADAPRNLLHIRRCLPAQETSRHRQSSLWAVAATTSWAAGMPAAEEEQAQGNKSRGQTIGTAHPVAAILEWADGRRKEERGSGHQARETCERVKVCVSERNILFFKRRFFFWEIFF